MGKSIDRMEFVHDFVKRTFSGSLHAKRILSLANGTLGVLTGASLAVSLIGHALAQARDLSDRHAIKQVDRLLSNAGIVVWDLFAPWVREVVGQRKAIVVAMDWTDFDADNQATLALSLITRHGRATPLLWLTVDKDELKDQRNDFEDLCLTRLKAILPEGVAVTILADRGFGDVKLTGPSIRPCRPSATTIALRWPTTSRTHGANSSHTTTPALLSRRSTCLIACLSERPRACASACPISETANDAPVRTPSVPLASDKIRLACKLPENVRLTNS